VQIKGPLLFTAQTVSRAAGSYIEVESGNHTVNENGGMIPPWVETSTDRVESRWRWNYFHLKVELQYFLPLPHTAYAEVK
jgi:hypothetical protein